METIEEIRHANLHLIAQMGNSQAAIARAVDVDRRQVNQWFVNPPLRNLSSEYARLIEEKLHFERGSLDHPGLGVLASQLSRLDLESLAKAILAVAGSSRPLTPESIAEAYGLLTTATAPTELGVPPSKPKGAAGHVVVAGGDSGAVEDPGRKGRPGKKGAA